MSEAEKRAKKMDQLLALLEAEARRNTKETLDSYPYMCGAMISHMRSMARFSSGRQMDEYLDQFIEIYTDATAITHEPA